MPKKNKKLALKLGIHTYQILTKNDEVCIPRLSSILLAVLGPAATFPTPFSLKQSQYSYSVYQLTYSGVNLALFWGYSGIILRLFLCYSDVIPMLFWCYSEVILNLLWGYYRAIMELF